MQRQRFSFWTEAERLAEVDSYHVAHAGYEAEFNDLVEAAAASSETPIALITVLTEDQQYFKAAVGTQLTGSPRAISFCTHAIEADETMIIADATADTRFADNPLVTGATNIRFYAGVPLRSAKGLPLGTLCVLDQKPREFTSEQIVALEALASQVIDRLERRKQKLQISKPC